MDNRLCTPMMCRHIGYNRCITIQSCTITLLILIYWHGFSPHHHLYTKLDTPRTMARVFHNRYNIPNVSQSDIYFARSARCVRNINMYNQLINMVLYQFLKVFFVVLVLFFIIIKTSHCTIILIKLDVNLIWIYLSFTRVLLIISLQLIQYG